MWIEFGESVCDDGDAERSLSLCPRLTPRHSRRLGHFLALTLQGGAGGGGADRRLCGEAGGSLMIWFEERWSA